MPLLTFTVRFISSFAGERGSIHGGGGGGGGQFLLQLCFVSPCTATHTHFHSSHPHAAILRAAVRWSVSGICTVLNGWLQLHTLSLVLIVFLSPAPTPSPPPLTHPQLLHNICHVYPVELEFDLDSPQFL